MAGEKQDEQSVGEILASIRQMMTDAPGAQRGPASTGYDDDVLVLTEIVTDDGTIVRLKRNKNTSVSQDPHVITGGAEVTGPVSEEAGKPLARVAVAMAELRKGGEGGNFSNVEMGRDRAALLSEATADAAVQSFSELTRVVREQEKSLVPTQTVDGLVREAITPLLQQWLEKNMGTIVEKLVREEIRRLTTHLDKDS